MRKPGANSILETFYKIEWAALLKNAKIKTHRGMELFLIQGDEKKTWQLNPVHDSELDPRLKISLTGYIGGIDKFGIWLRIR